QLPEPSTDLRGRTFIITGSNTGLGFAAAMRLARLNAVHVVLAVRSATKGAEARERIMQGTPGFKGTIDVWALDMGSFESVRLFAAKANDTLPRLDGALVNAGVASPQWHTSVDGWEQSLQVNGIATGLLSVLLLPLLQATSKLPPPHPDAPQMLPHLTITGSEAMFLAKFPEKSAPNILQALNE
ncbi:hypothetical protein DFH07DRAFT_683786, partial [Mycena maculata]